MPEIRIDDIKMYYEEAGSGEPLVLITGLAGSHRDWYLQFPFFAGKFRTVVMDNRGVGRTDKPKDGYSVRRFADDIAALMDHLKIGSAHVVGLSLGGMIAQELALSHPSRVRRLILCATNCGRKHSVAASQEVMDTLTETAGLTFEEVIRQTLPILFTERYMKDQPQEVEKYVQSKLTYPKQSFHSYFGQLQAAMEFDSYHRLPEIEHDTLVLTAGGDVLVPPENSDILADRIPGARKVVFEDGGHMFNIEVAERFNDEVLGFVAG
jgi:pimeloyl-ACP methyl ester carboxylesterase